MDRIIWDQKYNIGIEEIDKQHRYFIELLNKLRNKIILQETDLTTIQIIITEVFEYADYHFGAEEKLMLENSYPNIDEHKREHKTFTRHIKILNSGKHENKLFHVKALTGFMSKWLLEHIQSSDKKIGDFINISNE